MNKTYETMVLLDNRGVKSGWDALKSDVSGLFSKHDAKVVSARRWQERRLAYPIKGQQRATYLLVYHDTPTEGLVAIDRELRYSDVVLRHMTTAIEEIPAEAHEPEAEFDPDAIPDDDAPPEPKVEEKPKEAAAEKAEKTEKTEEAEASAEGEGKPAEGEAAPSEGESAEGAASEGASSEGSESSTEEKS